MEYSNNEKNCEWISSRGLLKSCDVYNRNPQSSCRDIDSDYLEKIKDYDIVHICSWLTITIFVKTIVPKLTKRIIVLSNDSDMDAPIFEKPVGPGDDIAKKEILDFINSDLCIHWFTQNCTLNHPKVTPIPIGMDYHTFSRYQNCITQEKVLNEVKNQSKSFFERIPLCYGNFHFNMENKYYTSERKNCVNEVPNNLVFYEPNMVNRVETWINQCKFAFVLSPAGGGIDCHRTWEAILLGCIPIVKRFNVPHDKVYDDLPILVVNNWSDISEILLKNTIQDFKTKIFNYDKLKLSYWTKLFNSYKDT
jgi:hypothetical protein